MARRLDRILKQWPESFSRARLRRFRREVRALGRVVEDRLERGYSGEIYCLITVEERDGAQANAR